MKNLLLALSAISLLATCGRLTPSRTEPIKIVLPELPEELKNCPKLQSVSSRLSDEEAEVEFQKWKLLWAQDRTVAVQCYREHQGVVNYYGALRANLMTDGAK